MGEYHRIRPLQAALSAAAEHLMAAVQAREDLERELDRERDDRNHEETVLKAAKRLKTSYMAYEEKLSFLKGIKISPKEKALALEPYVHEVQNARNQLFQALEVWDRYQDAATLIDGGSGNGHSGSHGSNGHNGHAAQNGNVYELQFSHDGE